jgi:hypothetical protein
MLRASDEQLVDNTSVDIGQAKVALRPYGKNFKLRFQHRR